MSEKKKMPHILHLVIFLSILGIVCAGLLAIINNITAKYIEENKYKELVSTFEAIGVSSPKELTNQTLVDGVEKIYLAKMDDADCYVFQVKSKNSFTTIDTLVVINKETEVILAVRPISGTPSFTTHGKDGSIQNHDYNVKGSTSSTYEEYFSAVSGATISSGSIKNSIRLAYEQLSKVKE